ncbi:MAG: Fe-S assembly protein IscX [Chloroflexi bacterium]|nr:MAG: Fe-S assembly protein IscX [Phototrophicales bacterium]RMF78647.1 MAG: Fe-S assembly protein IscX [Chloroflexota bacterium]
MDEQPQFPLYWDATYEIVMALQVAYPTIDVDGVGLEQLYQMIIALPNFGDDVELVNDEILTGILREWYEEVNPIDE